MGLSGIAGQYLRCFRHSLKDIVSAQLEMSRNHHCWVLFEKRSVPSEYGLVYSITDPAICLPLPQYLFNTLQCPRQTGPTKVATRGIGPTISVLTKSLELL